MRLLIKLFNSLRPALAILFLAAIMVSCGGGTKEHAEEGADAIEHDEEMAEVAGPNSLTSEEAEEGWILMFDGKTSEGWRGYGREDFPGGWNIEDGAYHCPVPAFPELFSK